MRRREKRCWWDLRWLTFRSLKWTGMAVLLAAAGCWGTFMLGARTRELQKKVRWHDLVSRQLRMKAQVAGLLADADQPTDYVMAYDYSCIRLGEIDPLAMGEAEANASVQEIVHSCAYFRSEPELPKTPRQLEMASRSSGLFIQSSRHAEAAAAYRRAIWIPWTVTQDVGVEKDEP